MATIAQNNKHFFPSDSFSTGVSQAFDDLINFKERIFNGISLAIIDERPKDLQEELVDIYKECSVDDWDSYGAIPLKEAAFFEAKKFISDMPSWLPTPEVVPEPNGDIGFQWDFGKDKLLVASLSGENIVVYASILGSSERRRNGSDLFNYTIPNEIINGVVEIQD